jgi:4-amino-4-deoxy-L-arabinose transferase-like glycosyltransferase
MVYKKKLKQGTLFFGILLFRIAPVFYYYKANYHSPIAAFDNDAVLYLYGAKEILRTGANQFNFFPPLNFLFIATFLNIAHESLWVPMFAIALIGWLTIIGVYLITRELFDEKTAIIAAILNGLYPNFIFYGITFYSETLTIFFIVFSFLMLVMFFKKRTVFSLLLVGILWGLASFTRGGLNYFIPFILGNVALCSFRQRSRFYFKHALIVLLSTVFIFFILSTIIPEKQGSTSFNSKNGIGSIILGANRLIVCCTDYGNVPGNLFYFINDCKEPWPPDSQLDMMELFKLNAIHMYAKLFQFISKGPIIYIKNSIIKLSNFWSPNQYVICFLKTLWGKDHYLFIDILCFMIAALYCCIVCGGLLGVILSRDPFRPVFISLVLFYCVLIFFTVGNSKLRLPLMPFFIVYCSYFITRLKDDSWKSVLSNKWIMIFIIIFFTNSLYKYQELLLSPAENQVQRIELCTRLGFPKTALCLLEDNINFVFTDNQKKRLETAKASAKEKVTTFSDAR